MPVSSTLFNCNSCPKTIDPFTPHFRTEGNTYCLDCESNIRQPYALVTDYWTIKAIATVYRVAQPTVHAWLKSKRLDGYKIGGCWRIKQDALDRFLSNT